MKQNNLNKHRAIVFRHFTRKGYALFSVLGREVRIGVLSVATLAAAAPRLAQAAATLPSDDAGVWATDTIGLDEAKVTATRAVSRVADATALQIVEFREQDLAAAGVSSINDVLKLAAGVDVRQRGGFGMQTDISIDGGNFDQIALFVNGFPINNPQTGHNSADFPLNLSDIRKIEVVNGAAAHIFGTQAFSGAINIVTREGGEYLRAGVAAGSYGTVLGEVRTALSRDFAEGTRSLTTSLSGSMRRSDGAVDNGDFKGGKAFWQATYKTRKYILAAQAGMTVNDFGANTFYSAAYPNQWEATRRFMASARMQTLGRIALVPEITWMRNTDHFQLIRGSNTAENFHRGDVFTLGVRSYTDWKIGNLSATTAAGAEMRLENIYSTNLGKPVEESMWFHVPGHKDIFYKHYDNRTNVGFSLAQHLRWRNVWASVSILAQHNSAAKRGFSLYPGASLAWKPSPAWRIYASWAKTLRLPTFTDLYYKSPTQEGNVGLKPEENSSLRIGATYKVRQAEVSVAAFYNHGRDMIDWVMRSPDDIFHAAAFQLRNMGASASVRLNLSEMLGSRQPLDRLTLAYEYIHQKRKDKETVFKSNYALEYLRHKFVARLRHRIVSLLTADWELRVQRREGGYLVYENLKPTGEVKPYGTHALLDLKLTWNAKHYELFCDLQNLTAKRYYDIAGVRQPGFLVLAGATFKW